MSNIAVEFTPNEFDRVLIALNWYATNREESADMEVRGVYDAGADESRGAAREASGVLAKLRAHLSAGI